MHRTALASGCRRPVRGRARGVRRRVTEPLRKAWRRRATLPRRLRGQRAVSSQCTAPRLLVFDCHEECFKVALAERETPFALNDLEEKRRPVLERLRENLEHIPKIVTIDQDVQLAEDRDGLVDLSDPRGE